MKKTYKLYDEKKNLNRIIEAIKNDVRKYIKREKRKDIDDDFSWKFACKSAYDENEIQEVNFLDLTKIIEQAEEKEAKSLYLEIISFKEKRKPREEKVVLINETKEENQEEIQEENEEKN